MFIYEKILFPEDTSKSSERELNIAFQPTQLPPENVVIGGRADIILKKDSETGTVTAVIGDNSDTTGETAFEVSLAEGLVAKIGDEEIEDGDSVVVGTTFTVETEDGSASSLEVTVTVDGEEVTYGASTGSFVMPMCDISFEKGSVPEPPEPTKYTVSVNADSTGTATFKDGEETLTLPAEVVEGTVLTVTAAEGTTFEPPLIEGGTYIVDKDTEFTITAPVDAG